MRNAIVRSTFIALLVFVAACSYSLPGEIQGEVDSMAKQIDSFYGTVESIKNTASGEKLDEARRTYQALEGAYGTWMSEVQNAITKEIDHFENDEKYINYVNRLNDASQAFEEAGSDALGSKVDVPDFANEMRNGHQRDSGRTQAQESRHGDLRSNR